MKQKKLKYSLKDPMVMILACLLGFLTVGTFLSGFFDFRNSYAVELDAAFGGTNKGYTGFIPEAEINEKTVDALEELLSKDDRFVVYRTHPSGTEASVADSALKIEEDAPDIAISIHGGWDPDENISGTRIYTDLAGRKGEKDAKKFAAAIVEAFNADDWQTTANYLYYHAQFNGTYTVEVTDANDKQAQPEEENPVTWTILENTEVPCVVVEQFFVSNKSDIGRWANAEGYQMIAQKYYSALCNYFSIEEINFEEEAQQETQQAS